MKSVISESARNALFYKHTRDYRKADESGLASYTVVNRARCKQMMKRRASSGTCSFFYGKPF